MEQATFMETDNKNTMPISFDNTKITFSDKSNHELRKAYWLFKLIGSEAGIVLGTTLLKAAHLLKLPVSWAVRPTIYSLFCGGETLQECEKVINRLAKSRIGTILDYGVEGKDSNAEFDKTAKKIIETIHLAKENNNIKFSVFKPTGIGKISVLQKASKKETLSNQEQNDLQKFQERVNTICEAAFQNGVPLLIDAEESWIQGVIDEIVREMMRKYNSHQAIIFNTFQMYRHDRLQYLKESYEDALTYNYVMGAKLVRGAYMEKEKDRAKRKGYPSPIHVSKQDTDQDYDLALKFCVAHISKIEVFNGTHNEKSSLYLTELMQQYQLPNNHPAIYFSQLLGMSDHISYNLAADGYNVVKYVPYGPTGEVLPYLIRRAEENTSISGQTGRELALITKELNRRKEG